MRTSVCRVRGERAFADAMLVYKILFGLMKVNGDILFTLRNQPHLSA